DAAIVRRGTVFALIDRSGKILADGIDEVAVPAEDANPIAVRIGDKWGLLDHRGHYRIAPRFEELEPLDITSHATGVGRPTVAYRATTRGRAGLLGLDGSGILPPLYDQVHIDTAGDGRLAMFGEGDGPGDEIWGFVDLATRKATRVQWDQVYA